jgi:hypothetical protein
MSVRSCSRPVNRPSSRVVASAVNPARLGSIAARGSSGPGGRWSRR